MKITLDDAIKAIESGCYTLVKDDKAKIAHHINRETGESDLHPWPTLSASCNQCMTNQQQRAGSTWSGFLFARIMTTQNAKKH